MKKVLITLLCATMMASLTACGNSNKETAEKLTGKADGFGGVVTVEVTKEGDKITNVVAVGDDETSGIGSKAIEELPAKIVEANSADADVVSGATVTSNAVIYAVNNALNPAEYPYPVEKVEESDKDAEAIETAKVYQGFGLDNTPRIGPGKDSTDTQVYSINQVFANVLFDEDGKILSLVIDQLETATPNYDGESMPHFSGFPGQSYNIDENHDETVDGTIEVTEDSFTEEVSSWVTKRDRGEDYKMGTGTWTSQIEEYQELFVGKTVEEIEEWYNKYCSDLNGRPLKEGSDKEEDKAKYDALSDEDKSMLADVVTGATMSLNDSHGNIIGAIKKAYENRVPLSIESASAQGFGLNNTPRIGPGKDDTDTQVYSVNQVFANTLFDEEGRIVSIYIDQLEYATPNYDGEGMPHFSGFPGQGGYNYDENHDEKVDGKTEDTEDNFVAEVTSWVTKRDRGDGYKMGTGTWASQMDKYQELFVGKTVEEVEEWFNKYCSDLNGRPLKEGSDKEEDKAKYDALSDDEKAMLTDVVTGATMSLSDSHGDILAAIKASYENSKKIDLKVK